MRSSDEVEAEEAKNPASYEGNFASMPPGANLQA